MNVYLKMDTIDLELLNALKENRIGSIHSVYSSVINISFKASSKIFSLAMSSVMQSPYMMRTADIEKFMQLTQLVEVGEPVNLIQTNQLRIGVFVIDWSLSSTWDKKLAEQSVTKEYIANRVDQLTKQLKKMNASNQLIKALLDEKMEVKNYFQARYQKIMNELKESFTAEKVSEIIGLGIGLTPSGDDFFTGCFSVLYVHNNRLAKEIANSRSFSSENILSMTTQVSANMIMHSFNGKVNHALYMIVMVDELSEKSIKNLQRIGSTSGEDMLAGVCFGYSVLMNTYKEERDDYKSKNRQKCLS